MKSHDIRVCAGVDLIGSTAGKKRERILSYPLSASRLVGGANLSDWGDGGYPGYWSNEASVSFV